MKNYTAIIERCHDTGLYVGFIPGFQGAHTQAETLDELNRNLQEVVEMLIENGEPVFIVPTVPSSSHFGREAEN